MTKEMGDEVYVDRGLRVKSAPQRHVFHAGLMQTYARLLTYPLITSHLTLPCFPASFAKRRAGRLISGLRSESTTAPSDHERFSLTN